MKRQSISRLSAMNYLKGLSAFPKAPETGLVIAIILQAITDVDERRIPMVAGTAKRFLRGGKPLRYWCGLIGLNHDFIVRWASKVKIRKSYQ